MHGLSEGVLRRVYIFISVVLLTLIVGFPLLAKVDVDFDPSVDFSKYKTYAFLGPVENLVMLAVDPQVLDDQVRRSVSRELSKKGLREVQRNQNADLVIRYWVNTSQQVNVASMGNWGAYGPFVTSSWSRMYDAVTGSSGKENTLVIDLIDPRTKKLAWRAYVTRRLSNVDKDWKKVDEEFTRAFAEYPPSEKEKETKRGERAAHPGK